MTTSDNILAPIAALALPDPAALTARAQRSLAFIQELSIDSAETYGYAADELRSVKKRIAMLEEQRTAITGPINAGLRAINAMFKGPADLLAQAETALKRSMLAWDQEQQRVAAEQRRRAEAAADAERQRLAAEAAERQREADAQAAAAAAATAAGDRQAADLAQAAAARAASEAQAAVTVAQMVIAAPPAVERAKVAGISTSRKLDFEVVDLHALVRHVAQHPELCNLLVADSVRLRAYVKGLGTACALPGVRVYEESVMSARAA